MGGLDYLQLMTQVNDLDIEAEDFSAAALICRQRIDSAYESRAITLHQWRILTEDTSLLQARRTAKRHDGWKWSLTPLDTDDVARD